MITGDQIACHLVGDYILQSDRMAQFKTRSSLVALGHAIWYAVPFGVLQPSLLAWLVIVVTHFFVDRYRLARYVVWLKNWALGAGTMSAWRECAATGYPPERPPWMAVWLLIIADNIIHILINGAALQWL